MISTKARPRHSTRYLRRHTTGGGWAGYEAAKAAWNAANPQACYQERDAAMRKLAKSFAV